MNDDWIKYSEEMTSGESQVLQELRAHCYAHYSDSSMLSGFFQGRVLSMISHMVKPSRVLEIGTYLGYSALCLAEGLADGGKVITLDIQEDTNKVAGTFVAKTEYAAKIEFLLGSGIDIIPTLTEEFDLVFIDADKPNYSNYYDLIFEKLRAGGVILADNVLWGGKVLADVKDEDSQSLYDFSQKVMSDDRVANVLLSIRDGLMVIRKHETPDSDDPFSTPRVYELSI
ncbi:MAG: O-methyltransferase [Pyrinomonadaceae bacterium]